MLPKIYSYLKLKLFWIVNDQFRHSNIWGFIKKLKFCKEKKRYDDDNNNK